MYRIIDGETNNITDIVIKEERNKIIQDLTKKDVPFILTDEGNVVFKFNAKNNNVHIIGSLLKLDVNKEIIETIKNITIPSGSTFAKFNGAITIKGNTYMSQYVDKEHRVIMILEVEGGNIDIVNDETELY